MKRLTTAAMGLALTISLTLPSYGDPAAGSRTGNDPAPGFALEEQATLISRLEPGETLFPISVALSRDNAHVAYAARNAEGKLFAALDRQRSEPFAGLAKGTPLLAGDAPHWAYIGYDAAKRAQAVVDGRPGAWFDGIDRFLFNPDGSRWACRAGRGRQQAVVTHDGAGALFDIILAGSGPVFSPDGRRLAYGAMNERKGTLVVDGQPTAVDGVVDQIAFSPDSRRLAYVLKNGDRMHLVCDGTPHPPYDAVTQVTFSPDSRRLAYMARTANRWIGVLSGKELSGGDAVGMPLFSPDSRQVAYAVHSGDRWHMAVDGETGPAFAEIGVYVYSPVTSRLAYMAQRKGGGACIVDDGTAGPVYDAVGMPVFSPDGTRLAYRASLDKRWFIVHDGRPHDTRYDGVRRPVFSPDSRHLAYVGIEGKQMVMVHDGHPLGRYDSVTFPSFSPEGTHVAYAGCHQDQWRLYVDGRAGQSVFDATLKEGAVVFGSDTQCHTVLLKMPGPEFWRLDVTVHAGPGTDRPRP